MPARPKPKRCKPPYWPHRGDEDALQHYNLSNKIFYVVGKGYVRGLFTHKCVRAHLGWLFHLF